jgi:methylated-DNA-[protein]-cysteine S-methyltransferase
MPVQYFESPLGWVGVHASETSVTAIQFLDEKPEITDHDSSRLLDIAVAELNQWFAGELRMFSFPFAQPGTDFQLRVWHTLTAIPFGQTISYKTLAIQLGDEKCIRAAGTANGKNQLAIVVPCHRVVGSNGSLVGYAGGLWRKQWLLNHEATLAGKAVQSALF